MGDRSSVWSILFQICLIIYLYRINVNPCWCWTLDVRLKCPCILDCVPRTVTKFQSCHHRHWRNWLVGRGFDLNECRVTHSTPVCLFFFQNVNCPLKWNCPNILRYWLSRVTSLLVRFINTSFLRRGFLFNSWMFVGHALECYVCTDQEGNREKCLRSTKTCEQGQDACFTEIKWGSKF